jgi:hypothetical protein
MIFSSCHEGPQHSNGDVGFLIHTSQHLARLLTATAIKYRYQGFPRSKCHAEVIIRLLLFRLARQHLVFELRAYLPCRANFHLSKQASNSCGRFDQPRVPRFLDFRHILPLPSPWIITVFAVSTLLGLEHRFLQFPVYCQCCVRFLGQKRDNRLRFPSVRRAC